MAFRIITRPLKRVARLSQTSLTFSPHALFRCRAIQTHHPDSPTWLQSRTQLWRTMSTSSKPTKLPSGSPTSSHASTSASGSPKSNLSRQHQSRQQLYATRNRSLLMYTSAVVVLAVGVTYAAVPLYRMFCAATGFAGTPTVMNTASGRFEPSRLVPVDGARRIRVHFNADRSEALPWKFVPQQKFVDVLPGESSLAFYRAKNESNGDVIGIATYNVTPDRIAPYFSKVECFCFEEQKLLAGEEVDMPLLFFIDKDMLDDPSCRNIDDIVLSYTFFRARRNAHGHLEPDAAEAVVQKSLGFDGYEHSPVRNTDISKAA